MDAAAASGIPVAGSAGGCRCSTSTAGVTLHQHVGAHACFDNPPDDPVHEVAFAAGSKLAGLYGPARRVNSLHHQTIDEVGEGFLATGRSADGAVEAIEAVDRPGWGSVAPRDDGGPRPRPAVLLAGDRRPGLKS